MERTIFLVDMDAYFASVEQAANPFLRGRPVVVCGKGRTVAAAASYEARAFGVKTGMNLYDVKRLCPSAVHVYGNHDKYRDTSYRIHDIFLAFTAQVEVFSIDECFLDVTRRVLGGEAPRDIALAIKRRIKDEIGVSCSIGIGPNKTVAKLASNLEKPDGLVEIRKEDVAAVFAELPLSSLQGVGVGKKIAAKLESLGIRTAGDLGRAPQDLLSTHFGIMGYHLRRLGSGENDMPVKDYGEYEQAKSVGHSHTFPKDTRSTPVVRAYLRMLSEKVGARMREAGLDGRIVTLTIRYSDFATVSRQQDLKRSVKHGREIYAAGCELFKNMLPLVKAVRLAGITVSGLAKDCRQGYLLESLAREERLSEVVDDINGKYGPLTIKPSSLLIAEKFGRKGK